MEKEFKQEVVQLAEIMIDDSIQQRQTMNDDFIDRYEENIVNGAAFPPVEIFFDGNNYYLADGFHRVAAYKKAGIGKICANVFAGDIRAATLHAAGSNSTHGLRRTNEDKRKAVTTLLMDKEWKFWCDNKIAKKCDVSHPFVAKIRRELVQQGIESPQTRLSADGRTMDTSNIGQSQNKVEPESNSSSFNESFESKQPNGSSEDASNAGMDVTNAELISPAMQDQTSDDNEKVNTSVANVKSSETDDCSQSSNSRIVLTRSNGVNECLEDMIKEAIDKPSVVTEDINDTPPTESSRSNNSASPDNEEPYDGNHKNNEIEEDTETLKVENRRLKELIEAKNDQIRIYTNEIKELKHKIECLEKEKKQKAYA